MPREVVAVKVAGEPGFDRRTSADWATDDWDDVGEVPAVEPLPRQSRLVFIAGRKIEGAAKPHHQRQGAFHLQRKVGQDAAHHRLLDQQLAEDLTVPRVVQRLQLRRAARLWHGGRLQSGA